MAWAKVVFALVVTLIIPPLWSFIRHLRQARKVVLPIFMTPVPSVSPITWVIGPLLFPIMKRLPAPICDWARYGDFFWQFPDRARSIQRFGPAFVIVSPGATQLVLADPAAGDELLSKTKQFIKPPEIYSAIEIFGPNVDTVNGEAWNRHRKLTTPPFNERNSSLVWKESLKQAQGMLDTWLESGAAGSSTTPSDTMKLALHVLTGAGFGQSYDYASGLTKLPEGHTMSYRDALADILSNILTAILVVNLPFSLGFIPAFKKVQDAMDEFKKYMVEMVEQERNTDVGSRDSLISVLVKAADASKSGTGHDTTANTLTYAITLLSVSPEVQDWISEEINHVFGNTTTHEWNYEEAFPRLKRCLALMYETLRLYGPVPSMPKTTDKSPQTLRIAGRPYEIPPKWFVVFNLVAAHSDPGTWGNDALTWRLQRFIQPAGGVEQVNAPSPGTSGPWASGPRVCPGKKFAQVEFVAVISYLFRKHRVRPVLLSGETPAQARMRVLDIVEDSGLEASPTVKMRHPERMSLVWSTRD